MELFMSRVIRAMKLDASLYEEVENDPTTMKQAMLVVLLSALAAGIGSGGELGFVGFVGSMLVALVGWFVWAGLTYLIGTKLLPGPNTEADMGQLLRTIGFAAAPGLLRVFSAIPMLGILISLVVSIWMLATFVVAVRQALDYEGTGRAVLVCLIGWFVYMGFFVVMALLFSGALLAGAALA